MSRHAVAETDLRDRLPIPIPGSIGTPAQVHVLPALRLVRMTLPSIASKVPSSSCTNGPVLDISNGVHAWGIHRSGGCVVGSEHIGTSRIGMAHHPVPPGYLPSRRRRMTIRARRPTSPWGWCDLGIGSCTAGLPCQRFMLWSNTCRQYSCCCGAISDSVCARRRHARNRGVNGV